MSRTASRSASVVLLIVAGGVAWAGLRLSGQAGRGTSAPAGTPFVASTKNGDWPSYTGDTRGSLTPGCNAASAIDRAVCGASFMPPLGPHSGTRPYGLLAPLTAMAVAAGGLHVGAGAATLVSRAAHSATISR